VPASKYYTFTRVNINLKIVYGLIEPRTMREDRRMRAKYAMLGVAAMAAFSTAAYSTDALVLRRIQMIQHLDHVIEPEDGFATQRSNRPTGHFW
jgi:hypothetical protein